MAEGLKPPWRLVAQFYQNLQIGLISSQNTAETIANRCFGLPEPYSEGLRRTMA